MKKRFLIEEEKDKLNKSSTNSALAKVIRIKQLIVRERNRSENIKIDIVLPFCFFSFFIIFFFLFIYIVSIWLFLERERERKCSCQVMFGSGFPLGVSRFSNRSSFFALHRAGVSEGTTDQVYRSGLTECASVYVHTHARKHIESWLGI